MNVVLQVDDGTPEHPGVEGEVASRYGREPFCGWLELLGRLEAIADRARAEASPPPVPPEDPPA